MKKLTLFFAIIGVLTSCENNNLTNNTAYIPPAPNYSQENMWFTILDDNQSGVDVFYIPSTWEFDWFTKDSVVCHYADITNQEHLDDMSIEMKKVADYMADGNRFYSPFYRHITLNTWATLNEDTICARYNKVSLKDSTGV